MTDSLATVQRISCQSSPPPTDRFTRTVGDDQLAHDARQHDSTNPFATGIIEVRKDLDTVAKGTRLHMLQDSVSQAHARRRAPRPLIKAPGSQPAEA